jgi:hypothetical protein
VVVFEWNFGDREDWRVLGKSWQKLEAVETSALLVLVSSCSTYQEEDIGVRRVKVWKAIKECDV